MERVVFLFIYNLVLFDDINLIMTGSIVMDIVTLCIAAVATGLKEFTKTKDDKGNVTGAGKIYTGIIIVALAVNIISKFVKSDEDERASKNRETQYKASIDTSKKISDTLTYNLNQTKSILSKTDTSIVRLSILQDSSNQIISKSSIILDRSNLIVENLKQELVLQRKTNLATQDLLVKSKELMDSINHAKENTDRIVNPLFPASFDMAVFVPFDNSNLKDLVDSIYKIKADIEAGRSEHLDFINDRPRKENDGKVISITFKNPNITLAGKFKRIIGVDHILYFKKKPNLDIWDRVNDVFLELILQPWHLNNSESNYDYIVSADFRIKKFYITCVYRENEYAFLSKRNDKISISDLYNSFLIIVPERDNVTFELGSLTILPENKSRSLLVSDRIIQNIGNKSNWGLFRIPGDRVF